MSNFEKRRQELLAQLNETGTVRSPELQLNDTPEDYRAYMDQVTTERFDVPCEQVDEPVVCYVIRAKECTEKCPVFINIHGGGYIYPSNEKDTMYCAHIAAAIKGIVVNVEYITTDRAVYPAALDQCYDAVKWVFANCAAWGGDPDRVSIGGQSAGGCLTASINLRAAQRKDLGGKFRMQLLNYPILDNYLACEHPEMKRHHIFSMLYAGGEPEVLKNPYASPIFAEDELLNDQPYTVMVLAGKCPGRKNAEKYALRLAGMGNEVTIRCFQESHHGYIALLADQWREAQDYVIGCIETC